MTAIKNLMNKFGIKRSDIVLFVGFLFTVPFYSLAWWFMVEPNPDAIWMFPAWAIILCFTCAMLLWGYYFYLEIKDGNVPKNIATWLFIFFVVLSIIAVLVQPSHFERDVVMRVVNDHNQSLYPGTNVGDLIHVVLDMSWVHYMFFTMGTIIITTIFYIVYFILPKRFKTLNFILIPAIAVFLFLTVLIGYSYITEYDHYIPFLKALFGQGTMDDVYKYAVCSFIVHRVPYGVCMMLGLVFAINVHTITKKWYWWLLIAFYYINMIFSYCKTSLIISALLIAIYVIYRLIVTYKDHPKRNKITFICLGSLAGLGLVLVAVSYLTQGAVLSPIYKMIESVTGSDTMDTRSYIWDNTYQLLQNGWWLLGRGFGIYNMMLFPMNIVNGDEVCPSHSSFNAVLGAGGIFALLGYIALIIYWGYMFTKCFKKDPDHAMSLSFGALAFILYSFTEGVNYLVCVFIFPMFVLYNITKDKPELAEQKIA